MVSMKKIIVAVGLAFTCISLSQARPYEQITQSGELIFANARDFPPFFYMQNQKLQGFEIDFGNALAKRLGLKPVWRNVAFDSLFGKLNEQKIDVALASHTITPTREKLVDFVVPHYCTGTVVVALPGQNLEPKELSGKSVAVVQSTTFAQYARGISGVKVIPFATAQAAFQALQNKKVAAYVSDRLAVLALAKQFPSPKVNLSPLLTEDRIAMAVKKGNSELLARLNSMVSSMVKDGTIDRLAIPYFSSTRVTCLQ
jgi:polar amino acid transport system substrate-binding protein